MSGAVLGFWLVSSYCCVGAGGGYCGRTASGTQVHQGSAAAGPGVPYGTRLVVEGIPWVVTVDDRGPAIGDGQLDVFLSSCQDARAWGLRRVLVRLAPDDGAELEPTSP